MPHFILYPTLEPGCFLSLTGISFDEILEKSKSWDKEKPLLDTSELSRLYDLTDNDIIIRQINCSQILERLLAERVQSKGQPVDL
jgi:phosphatidylinositol N-acetylglucosaminyltransferase subunit Q